MVPSMLDLDIDGLLNESKIKLLAAFNNSNEAETHTNNAEENMDQVNDMLDGQMTDYDKALFAEVDKLSSTALSNTSTEDVQENENQNNFTTEKIRPLSPESLFDELSVSNSPLINKEQTQTAQKPHHNTHNTQEYQYDEHDIENGLQQIQDYSTLLENYNDLKEEYATKCKELNKVLAIFKEMEAKRFELTQENQCLRNSLSQLLFRSGQSNINTNPFQL